MILRFIYTQKLKRFEIRRKMCCEIDPNFEIFRTDILKLMCHLFEAYPQIALNTFGKSKEKCRSHSYKTIFLVAFAYKKKI